MVKTVIVMVVMIIPMLTVLCMQLSLLMPAPGKHQAASTLKQRQLCRSFSHCDGMTGLRETVLVSPCKVVFRVRGLRFRLGVSWFSA